MHKNSTERFVRRNNANVLKEQNKVSDLQKISSRIICSNNITRKSLNREPITSVSSDDDDNQFFQKIKSEIDKDIISNSSHSRKKKYNYGIDNLSRNKRPIVEEETENIIKRFKKDTGRMNNLETLSNKSTTCCNHPTNTKETCHVATNTSNSNAVERKNIFTSNNLNTSFRNCPNKCLFQMETIQANNITSSSVNHQTIMHTKYKEVLCYELTYLRPSDFHSPEDIREIEM